MVQRKYERPVQQAVSTDHESKTAEADGRLGCCSDDNVAIDGYGPELR